MRVSRQANMRHDLMMASQGGLHASRASLKMLHRIHTLNSSNELKE